MESKAWDSGLSVGEFVLLRGAGFEPVGQVMGASVQYLGPRTRSFVDCGFGRQTRGMPKVQVSAENNPADLSAYVTALYQTRRTAMAQLSARCTALGGDGVVAVHLDIGEFMKTDRSFRFQVTGTAVRARGAAVRPARPFMSALSGQDFAKLVASGWIPVDLVLGAAVGIRHGDYLGVRGRNGQSVVRGTFDARAPAQEVRGWSELVTRTRHAARRYLQEDAAGTGAEGLLLSSDDLRAHERPCQVLGGRDDVAEATMIGTAIVSFSPGRHLPPALPILRL